MVLRRKGHLLRTKGPLREFLIVLFGLLATPVWAAVTVTPRHLIILRPGLDSIYGSYIFAVHNDSEKSERLKTRVMLPKETLDFVPQEGLEPTEIALGTDGGVNVEKDIPKGVHVLGVGFKVDGRYGKTKLSLTPEGEIRSLTILVPRDTSVDLLAPGLKVATGADADDPQYRAFVNADPLSAGAPFVVEVSGLPEGRARLWLTGGVIAACMVLGAAFLAFRTRPKIKENQTGETVLVG
jgi:hypothetical protein